MVTQPGHRLIGVGVEFVLSVTSCDPPSAFDLTHPKAVIRR